MTTQAVLQHHLEALGAGDVDALLDDYTDASTFVGPDGVIAGLDALRAGLEGFLAGPFKPGTYELAIDRMEVVGDTAYILWHSDHADFSVPMGTDTFLIRDGKIVTQTFAMHVVPK